MKRSTILSVITFTLLMADWAGPARAQQQPSVEDDQKARELFRLGENHYTAGRYEKAAVLYDEAYRLSGRPELLLAMVNTYERMGDYPQAIEHLRQYLKHPKAKNVGALRERLRRLESVEGQREAERQRLRELENAERDRSRQALRPLPQAATLSNGPTLGTNQGRDKAASSGPSRMPAYLFLAGGALGLGGAITFGILSREAGQAAEAGCSDDGLCEDSAQNDLDREQRYAILADVSGLVGLGSAAVGAYLLWKTRGQSRETRQAVRIEPSFLPGGGAGVGIAGDF